MKYVVVLGDGMADQPIEELGGKTPLEYAKTPMMDELAKVSEIGMVHTVPDGMSPGTRQICRCWAMIRRSITREGRLWRR